MISVPDPPLLLAAPPATTGGPGSLDAPLGMSGWGLRSQADTQTANNHHLCQRARIADPDLARIGPYMGASQQAILL